MDILIKNSDIYIYVSYIFYVPYLTLILTFHHNYHHHHHYHHWPYIMHEILSRERIAKVGK